MVRHADRAFPRRRNLLQIAGPNQRFARYFISAHLSSVVTENPIVFAESELTRVGRPTRTKGGE
jgi:hypothetical protein